MFNMNDPTVRDRYTMLRIGERMVRAHPLTGVGPNMVQRLYVSYKGPDTLVGPDGVTHINPHLHNDFLQIAAERGLPALALWLWFIVALMRDLWKRFQAGQRELAATAMAIVVALPHRRTLRVQLRRFRSADCSSSPSSACPPPPRVRPLDDHAAADRRWAGPAIWSGASPICPCWWSATSCSIASWSDG